MNLMKEILAVQVVSRQVSAILCYALAIFHSGNTELLNELWEKAKELADKAIYKNKN